MIMLCPKCKTEFEFGTPLFECIYCKVSLRSAENKAIAHLNDIDNCDRLTEAEREPVDEVALDRAIAEADYLD